MIHSSRSSPRCGKNRLKSSHLQRVRLTKRYLLAQPLSLKHWERRSLIKLRLRRNSKLISLQPQMRLLIWRKVFLLRCSNACSNWIISTETQHFSLDGMERWVSPQAWSEQSLYSFIVGGNYAGLALKLLEQRHRCNSRLAPLTCYAAYLPRCTMGTNLVSYLSSSSLSRTLSAIGLHRMSSSILGSSQLRMLGQRI